ncbi:Nn.00g024020.m01.CDS01 [Neocucurbitaria sp. VM-36]
MAPPSDKKLYLKAPDLDFDLNGPIKIGNIIKDMKYPQDPIAALDPLPAIISGPSYGKGKQRHESYGSVKLSLSAKIFEVFGGQAEAKASSTLRTVYEFDEIEALYLQTNPTVADAQNLWDSNNEVKGALSRGPVYIVTGLKIAKGLKYANRRTGEKQALLGKQDHVIKEFAVGGTVVGNKREEDIENYTVKGDTILAYRLHIIKRRGFRWLGESEIDARTFDPGAAGFMNHDEKIEKEQVEIGEVSQQEVEYFVEDYEYGGLHKIDIEDEVESWAMLCIEG